MAEILLSLTIIGVVAAITLPSLTGNINERTWNTQRKALYARFSQAIALMPALNGYGTLTEDESGNIEDTAAEAFVTDGLSKVLKINNICDNEHLQDCGIPSKINAIDGNIAFSKIPQTLSDLNTLFTSAKTLDGIYSYNILNIKAVAFETANGESILTYYNPNCTGNLDVLKLEIGPHFIQPSICVNFIYDLNGSKGPNTMGKDIGFITALYASDSSVVAPIPLKKDSSNSINHITALSACKKSDTESRLPNVDELASMFMNKQLLGDINGIDYWSSKTETENGTQKAWIQVFKTGSRYTQLRNMPYNLRCVKR